MSVTIVLNIFSFLKKKYFFYKSFITNFLILESSKHSYNNNELKKYLFVLYKSYAWFSVFILGKYLWDHVMSPTNMCCYNQLLLFTTSRKQNVCRETSIFSWSFQLLTVQFSPFS